MLTSCLKQEKLGFNGEAKAKRTMTTDDSPKTGINCESLTAVTAPRSGYMLHHQCFSESRENESREKGKDNEEPRDRVRTTINKTTNESIIYESVTDTGYNYKTLANGSGNNQNSLFSRMHATLHLALSVGR